MMDRPHRWNIREIQKSMLTFGLISTAFDMITFGTLIYWFRAGPELFRTAWFVESLLTELAVVYVLRTFRLFYRSVPGKLLVLSTATVLCLTLALPYLPLARYLGFVPLPPVLMAVVLLITGVYVSVSEAAKLMLRKRAAAGAYSLG